MERTGTWQGPSTSLCSSFLSWLFICLFFEVRFYNVDQTGFKLTEIHLSSAWNAGIKGVFHHAQHTVHYLHVNLVLSLVDLLAL